MVLLDEGEKIKALDFLCLSAHASFVMLLSATEASS